MRTLNDKTLLLNPAEFAAMQTDPAVARETILENAVQAGKITAASRDHYRSRYQRDRAGTVQLLASLAPGVKPSDARTLREMERRQDDELLASARNAFPELRRRASAARPPVLPVASAHRAVRWPPDQSGLLSGSAPFPAGLNVGD